MSAFGTPSFGTPNGSSRKHEIVVASNTVDQPLYRQIMCVAAGNITIQGLDDSVAITYPLLQGQNVNLFPKRITTATTATLIGFY